MPVLVCSLLQAQGGLRIVSVLCIQSSEMCIMKDLQFAVYVEALD